MSDRLGRCRMERCLSLGNVSDGLKKVSDDLGKVSDRIWKVSDGI